MIGNKPKKVLNLITGNSNKLNEFRMMVEDRFEILNLNVDLAEL